MMAKTSCHDAAIHASSAARPQFPHARGRVGPTSGPSEREADRIANAVVLDGPVGAINRADGVVINPHSKSAGMDAFAGGAGRAVHAVSHGGTPLTPEQRAYYEPRFGRDFSDVRLHTDTTTANAAFSIGARAYTVGKHIGFAHGQYHSTSFRSRSLLAHELVHTLQQDAGSSEALVQRQPDQQVEIEMPAEWAFAADPRKRSWRRYARSLAAADSSRIRKAGTLSDADRAEINAKLSFFEGEAHDIYATEIRPALTEVTKGASDPQSASVPQVDLPADLGAGNAFFQRMREHPNYIDSDIKEVNYFTAELAHIHYRDGSMLKLGLVPRWMKPPVVEVDYHTPRDHFNIVDRGKDGIAFFRRFELADVPGSTPYAELLKTYSHNINFYAHESGRIVPSHVNMLTAPTLCAVLLDSERRYLENVDLGVQVGLGGTAAIGPYAGAGGWVKAPGAGLGARTAARAVLNPVTRGLAREMEALIGQGGAKTIEAGGIRFTDVVVSKQGSNLAVKRFEIRRVNAPPGHGSIAAEAFEDAAMNVARSHQMKSVSINVGVIINPGWRQWMESLGYVFNQAEGAWIKTIKL